MEALLEMSEKELSKYDLMIRVQEKTMSQTKAAQLLGISDRHFRRLLKAYRSKGAAGLISKRRGKPSNNRLPDSVKKRVLELLRRHYRDFGPTLACEKLFEEHQLKVSSETLRKWMIEAGLWKRKRRKKPSIHQSRNRRSCLGELIQIDGSPHDWFEGRRNKCTLLGFIDDATSRIMHLRFVESETTEAYFRSMKIYFESHGKPEDFYSDRFSVFRVNNDRSGYRGSGMTELARALKELDVGLICANSPQAKGRVERLFSTLQDRLVKELRLRRISSIEEANKYIPEYIEGHNLRFTHDPENSKDAHRSLRECDDLDKILCYKTSRKLTKNLELSYNNRILQIQEEQPSYALRGAQVEVIELLSGETLVKYKGKELVYKELLVKDHQGRVMNRKELLNKADLSGRRVA